MDKEFLATIAISALAAFVILMHRKWRDRIHDGKLEISKSGQKIQLTGSHGSIVLDPAAKTLTSSLLKASIPFSQVTAIDVLRDERSADWQEMIFEGWGITDLLPHYRDKVRKAILILICNDQKIPVMIAAQYEVRDFLDVTTPVLHTVLRWFGAYQHLDDFMEDKRHLVKELAKSAGLILKDLESDWIVS